MIFASLGYNNITLEEVNIEKWCNIINNDRRHCINIKYDDYPNNINPLHLPSWHPYWREQVRLADEIFYNELFIKYLKLK